MVQEKVQERWGTQTPETVGRGVVRLQEPELLGAPRNCRRTDWTRFLNLSSILKDLTYCNRCFIFSNISTQEREQIQK